MLKEKYASIRKTISTELRHHDAVQAGREQQPVRGSTTGEEDCVVAHQDVPADVADQSQEVRNHQSIGAAEANKPRVNPPVSEGQSELHIDVESMQDNSNPPPSEHEENALETTIKAKKRALEESLKVLLLPKFT